MFSFKNERHIIYSAIYFTKLVIYSFIHDVSVCTADDPPLPYQKIFAASDSIIIDGMLTESSWSNAPVISDFVYPWFEDGQKEKTEARLLWDETNLYVSFIAHDQHISAYHTKRESPVSKDDCVEVFIAPDTSKVGLYYNFEFNARTTILDRSPYLKRSSEWNADGLQVATNIMGTLNDHSDIDNRWITEIAIPFSNFSEFAPNTPPKHTDQWRLNLYRTGGEINLQYATWSNTLRPKPQFHAPDRFGIVEFSHIHAVDTHIPRATWGKIKTP